MAYVFTLAGDMQTRKTLLDHLNSVAVREGKPGLPVTSAWILSSARAKPTSRLFRFCRRLPSLESEVSWDVSLSVGGDQRLRHAGFPQRIAAHHWGTRPSLKHRQVAHPAAEPFRRLLVYPGNLEDEVLDMSWLEHLVYHSWMLNSEICSLPLLMSGECHLANRATLYLCNYRLYLKENDTNMELCLFYTACKKTKQNYEASHNCTQKIYIKFFCPHNAINVLYFKCMCYVFYNNGIF